MAREEHKLSIALLTTRPEAARCILDAVASDGTHEVGDLVTIAPQKEAIGPLAERHGTALHVLPTPLRDFRMDRTCDANPEYRELVESLVKDITSSGVPDVVVTFGFPLVPAMIPAIASLAAINFHPSDLPAYRGLMPLEAMILDGSDAHCFTAHHIGSGIDDGEVIAKTGRLPIAADATCGGLWDHAMDNVVGPFLISVLDMMASGRTIAPEEPVSSVADESPVPVAFGRQLVEAVDPVDGTTRTTNIGVLGRVRVEWELDSADDLERAARAFDGSMSPWMKLFTDYEGRPFAIDQLVIQDGTDSVDQPGTIVEVIDQGTVTCATSDGRAVRITGRFRTSSVRPELPELVNGGVFRSRTPIGLQTGFPMNGLERTVKP